jgi:hypothetical protein
MMIKRLVALGLLSLTLTGCVMSLRGVSAKKPRSPEEHVILFFCIPVYYSADTRDHDWEQPDAEPNDSED